MSEATVEVFWKTMNVFRAVFMYRNCTFIKKNPQGDYIKFKYPFVLNKYNYSLKIAIKEHAIVKIKIALNDNH